MVVVGMDFQFEFQTAAMKSGMGHGRNLYVWAKYNLLWYEFQNHYLNGLANDGKNRNY